MKESTRLIKNTGIIAVGGMATKLVQFLLLPLYTSVLSTDEYGVVDYINTIVLFLMPVVSLLMDEALFRFLIDCKTSEERSEVVTSSCLVLLFGSFLFSILMILIWSIFRPENIIWVIALVLTGTMLQMTSAILRGFGETSAYALMNFVASILTVLLNIIFIVLFHLGVFGMFASSAISQGVTSCIFLIKKRVWRYLDFSITGTTSVRSLIKYSIPLIPNKVSWTIMNMIDRLIIMNVLGAGPAGIYAVAYKFPNVMDTVYSFFYQSWKESSARALNSNEDVSYFYNSVYRALRYFMASVVLVMTAFMPLIYNLLIEGSYKEGMLYVPILLMATYYSNISGYYGGIFTAHRDTGIMGTTTIVSAVLCLVLCILLIPSIGLWGASLATLIATFTVNEYRLAKVTRHVRLGHDYLGRVVALLIFGIVLFFYYSYVVIGNILFCLFGILVSVFYSLIVNRQLFTRVVFYLLRKLNQHVK